MPKLLLMPSARLVPPELQLEFGAIPSAMVPLDSRPAMHYVADRYLGLGFDVAIAVHEKAGHVSAYQQQKSLPIQVIDVGPTASLGETVLRSLELMAIVPEQLVLNFADTYVDDELAAADVVCYQEQADVFRWTVFELGIDHQILRISDKGVDKSVDGSMPIFVGVFSFSQPARLIQLLRQHVASQSSVMDPFYQAIADYFNGLSEDAKVFQKVVDWRDFGHLDTYHETRKSFYLNKRVFNQVHVDARRGVVRKTSRHEKKFIDEINWYLKLPKNLSYMAPRVFDYSLDPGEPFVEMEFYGYPALNDLYLFGDRDMGVWSQIFQAIEHLMDDMAAYQLRPQSSDALRQAMREMYEGKTSERLAPVLLDERFAWFCQDRLVINGRDCLGLPAMLETLGPLADAMGLYAQEYFTILHGDLCLSNILFDPRNRLVRVIDPRGAFGPFDLHGDPRYDLAKLCHSLEGDYDFLLNDMFDLYVNGDCLTLNPYLDPRHIAIKSLFHQRATRKWGEAYRQAKFIESLLFVSMVPLHADRFRSQQAFLARGLEIFSGLASEVLSRGVTV